MAFFNDRRQFERRPHVETMDYSVSILEFDELKRLNLQCKTLDISSGGLGIKTDFPLEPGHVVTFKGVAGYKIGIVRWAMKLEDTSKVGLKFV